MSVALALTVVLVVGAATYAMRSVPILALADRDLPPIVATALRNVAPAVLAALVVTLIADTEAANRGVTLAEVLGLVAAAPVAWKTRNLAATLAVGMTVLWVTLALT